MSSTVSVYGYVFHDADPDVSDGVYGFRDSAGVFHSNEELREMAATALRNRVDGRSPKDVLAEALDDEQAIEMLVSDIHQPEDNASWALDSETGRWSVER